MHDATPPRTARALAEVLAARTLTPHMRRITLGGAEVARFLQADGTGAPAAWVKVFLPCGTGRAYTLRHIDRAAETLEVDLVLHGHGPASAWAARHGISGRALPRDVPVRAWVDLFCTTGSSPPAGRVERGRTVGRSRRSPG